MAQSNTFSRSVVIDSARFARMAYSDPDAVSQMYETKSGDFETVQALKKVTSPPVFFNDPSSDAQGYGLQYTGEDGPMVLLALRGTSSLADAIADAEIKLTHLKTKLITAPKDVLVHSGFLGQFLALETQMDDYVRKIYGLDPETQPKTLPDQITNESLKDEILKKIDPYAKSLEQFFEKAPPVTEPVQETISSLGPDTLPEAADVVTGTILDLSSKAVDKAKDELTHIQAGDPQQVVSDAKQNLPSIDPSVKDLVTPLVNDDSTSDTRPDSDDIPLLVTGHSLGAANSSIAALVFNLKYGDEVKNITFGSPLVGNKAWVKLFNNEIGASLRYKAGRDPVTTVPPPILYQHVDSFRHIGRADPYSSVPWLNDLSDHDITYYISCLQKDDTSERPMAWLPYLYSFIVDTPVKVYNFIKTVKFYSPS